MSKNLKKTIVLIPHIKRFYPLREYFFKTDDPLYACQIATENFRPENCNEDPYIWSPVFIYSFCHANHALTQKLQDKVGESQPIYYCFVSPCEDDSNLRQIDTIIKAARICKWPKPECRNKTSIEEFFKEKIKVLTTTTNSLNDILTHHLPLKDEKMHQHNNKVLHTCIGDQDESYLPLYKEQDIFRPFRFDKVDSKNSLIYLKEAIEDGHIL